MPRRLENLRNILRHVGPKDIVIPFLETQRNRPLFRRLTSRTFVLLVNLLFGLRIRYYNGAVVHKTRIIRSVDIGTNSFAYQAEALDQAAARRPTRTSRWGTRAPATRASSPTP